MGWKDRIQTVETPKQSWRDRITDAPDISKTESFLRGGSQGITGGFLDEIGGAMSAAGRAAGVEGLGGK